MEDTADIVQDDLVRAVIEELVSVHIISIVFISIYPSLIYQKYLTS